MSAPVKNLYSFGAVGLTLAALLCVANFGVANGTPRDGADPLGWPGGPEWQNAPVPVSLAAGDFDGDGRADAVAGHTLNGRGRVTLHRAVAPAGATSFTPARTIVDLPLSPDFLAVGDFDADGRLDAVAASRSWRELVWLRGDGLGGLERASTLSLPGPVTALAAGDVNRPDGLADLAIAVGATAAGGLPQLLVFESPAGALRAEPEAHRLSSVATEIRIGRFAGDAAVDLEIVTAAERVLVHGRDRRLTSPGSARTPARPALITREPLLAARAADRRHASGADAPPDSFQALPMRLNDDAAADVLLLEPGAATPRVSLAAIAAAFVVDSAGDGSDASIGDGTIDGICDADPDASIQECTLRAAIEEANATAGLDSITFSIGVGPQTIPILSPLPAISDELTIDGSDPAGLPAIELTGGLAGAGADGLTIAAANCTVRGLIVNGFDGSGVVVTAAGTNALIAGNSIGTDVSGTSALANAGLGVHVDGAADVTIGGTTSTERNVISGNGMSGVLLSSGATGAIVAGNYIGTDQTGTAEIANGSNGVRILASSNNVIGGTTASSRNVISGNDRSGIQIASGSTMNLVVGNYIGTDVSGSAGLGNLAGILIAGAPDNTIGATAGGGNLVSGNRAAGVQLSGLSSTGNLIVANKIGTNAPGTSPLANSGAGVRIVGTDAGDSPSGNTVGGATEDLINSIAFNGASGVTITGVGTGNLVTSNEMDSNGEPGIDLGSDGVTANDADDADAGPNNLQNSPEIQASDVDPNGNLVVEYFVDSAGANSAYPIGVEVFLTGSGSSQGKTLLDTDSYLLADFTAGSAVFDLGPADALGFDGSTEVASGDFIVATATDAAGNTSEFSPGFETNDAPEADDDDVTTDIDTLIEIDVLANDTDVDGNLEIDTIVILTAPTSGTATPSVDADGTLTGFVDYEPNPGFQGNDSFGYTVEDNDGAASNEATVTVEVTANQAPVANADAADVKEGTPTAIDVAANDTDADGTVEASTIAIVSAPANGAATTDFDGDGTHDGTVTYTPDPGFVNDTDTFTYTVDDDGGATSNEATVTVSVNPNQAPNARDDAATTDIATRVTIEVLTNDRDPDGTIDAATLAIVTPPADGMAVIQPDATIDYTPRDGFIGDDTFEYTVADDDGAVSDPALVTITVRSLNQPPVAGDDLVRTEVDTPIEIDVLLNDADGDATPDPLVISSATDPPNGTVTLDADGDGTMDGTVTYTPDPGFVGDDFFIYTAEDGRGGTDGARVDVEVVRGPDLTGQWIALVQNCGKRCKVLGSFEVTNRGQVRSRAFRVEFYRSTDATFDSGDELLRARGLKKLKEGRMKVLNFRKRLKKGDDAAGEFVIAVIDPADRIRENFEDNNTFVFGPIP